MVILFCHEFLGLHSIEGSFMTLWPSNQCGMGFSCVCLNTRVWFYAFPHISVKSSFHFEIRGKDTNSANMIMTQLED